MVERHGAARGDPGTRSVPWWWRVGIGEATAIPGTRPEPSRGGVDAARSRDVGVDAIKGFLILCVIGPHVPFASAGVTLPRFCDAGIEMIYMFHMPLFFAIALFFRRTLTWVAVRKAAASVLVPYVFWYCFFHPRFVVRHSGEACARLAMGNWASLQSVYWFLPAVFSVILVGLLVEEWLKRARVGVVAGLVGGWLVYFAVSPSIAVKMHPHVPFGVDLAIYMAPYCLAIKWLFQNVRDRAWLSGSRGRLAGLAMTASGFALMFSSEAVKTHTPFHHLVDLAQYSVPHTLPGYGAMVLVSAGILLMFMNADEDSRTMRVLGVIGRCSLPIFLLHMEVMGVLIKVVPFASLSPAVAWLAVAGVACAAVAVPMVVSRLLSAMGGASRWIGMVG